jgi:hypothetical protein
MTEGNMNIKNYFIIFSISCSLPGLLAAAETPAVAPLATAPAPAAPAPQPSLPVAKTRLDPEPTTGAVPLPAGTDILVRGYGQQAQQGLLLAYFSAGTLADALLAGSVTAPDGLKLADSYLTLATTGRDDLRHVRAAYAFDAVDLDQLDKLAAAYGDVIPLIESARKLASGPVTAENRAAFEAARRKAFTTLGTFFNWK